MSVKKILILLVVVGLYACSAKGQQVNKVKLDSFFSILEEHNEAMGNVTLSKNGRVLYSRAIGSISIDGEHRIPANTQTKYRIASITKMFTATMIFQLIEEHKLNLTTTLYTYFPELPNAKIITISEMISHRSGLHNFISSYRNMTSPKTENELLAMIAMSKPDFRPDSTSEYSNTNYWLLGFIIERICKMSYADALQQRIVAKLGLRDTYYGDKIDLKKNECYSYSFDGNDWQPYPETDPSYLGGAGAIMSTTQDLTKFIEALYSDKLISAHSLEQMAAPEKEYGMGMAQVPFDYHMGHGHTGHIDGYYSILCYFPDDSLAVAYCSNGHVYELNSILKGILSYYFDSPFRIPDFKGIATHNLANLDNYAGIYSCKDLPIKITITKNKASLMAQATGQHAFAMHPIKKDRYRYDKAEIEMDFNTDTHAMVFRQEGLTFMFTRQQ